MKPTICLAIIAKQGATVLPLYLKCIDNLIYPKDKILVYIRSNNNTDHTVEILSNWIKESESKYNKIEYDFTDSNIDVSKYSIHEWNVERFKVLSQIRQKSLQVCLDWNADYYFVSDIDNFLLPHTLESLVKLQLPIISPMLKSDDDTRYSNYHAEIDSNGYYKECNLYNILYYRQIKGIIEVPVMHCTYLLKSDIISKLSYIDESGRHEYVILSECARKMGIPQYLDNRVDYGILTLRNSIDKCQLFINNKIM